MSLRFFVWSGFGLPWGDSAHFYFFDTLRCLIFYTDLLSLRYQEEEGSS